MTNTQTLYQSLVNLLDRGQWQDQRHLKDALAAKSYERLFLRLCKRTRK
jgi:hypothetical protein